MKKVCVPWTDWSKLLDPLQHQRPTPLQNREGREEGRKTLDTDEGHIQ